MTITVVQEQKRFVARCRFEDKDIVKAAGFKWDREYKQWFTTDPAIAAVFSDPNAADKILAAQQQKAIEAERNIEASRAADADVDLPCPEGLSYLPYQRAGIAAALNRPCVLFGDEMGLGKTIQAIGILNADPSLKTILIICPATLKLNWYRELKKWLTRPLSISIVGSVWPHNWNITIINYDILDRWKKHIHAIEWDAVIVDEAHYLKNPDAKRTQAVVGQKETRVKEGKPAIRARRKIFLTGTPIPNRPVEAWSIFSYLGAFNNFWNYVTRYCDAQRSAYGWDFNGSSNLLELQDKLRGSIMIRRKKADVLTDLPAKRRVVIQLDPEGCEHVLEAESDFWDEDEQAMMDLRVRVELAKASEDLTEYETAVAEMTRASRLKFEAISKLRHDTAVAKLPRVIDHILETLESDEGKIVVFAHHKDVIRGLAESLRDKKIESVQITGETPQGDRMRNVDVFQKDPNCRVFLGNIQAAGVGITLTAASLVMFAELDWVPGNVTQCEDRCHRIGQRDSVLVQHLVLDGSLDARMAEILINKQIVIDQALDAKRPAAPEVEVVTPVKDRAATEGSTVNAIATLAAKLTPENIEAIHAGLRILAGLDGDRARDLNGIGFSRLDTKIGHSLAQCGKLSPKQAALGFRLVLKYRRQLPADLIAQTGHTA